MDGSQFSKVYPHQLIHFMFSNQSARACSIFIAPLARMSARIANTGRAAARINSFQVSYVAEWPGAPKPTAGVKDQVYIRWNAGVEIVQKQPSKADEAFGMAADTGDIGFAEI